MATLKVILGYLLANATKIGAMVAFLMGSAAGDATSQIISGVGAAITGILVLVEVFGQRFLHTLPSPTQN